MRLEAAWLSFCSIVVMVALATSDHDYESNVPIVAVGIYATVALCALLGAVVYHHRRAARN